MSKKPLPSKNPDVTIKPRSKQERAFWLFMAILVGVGLLLLFTVILATIVLRGNPLN